MFKIIIWTILLVGLAPTPCSAEFRDPTQPAYPPSSVAGTEVDSHENTNELILSAIWISSHSKRATINNINAKEGQTIVIEQTPALKPALTTSANTVSAGDKTNELLNKAMKLANTKSSNPAQDNIISSLGNMAGPLGSMIAPLVTSAIGSMDIPQLQGQSAVPADTHIQQPDTARPKQAHHASTPRSITIKIVSIEKNSVIIDQNGELKTLQLVQSPYKTARNKH